MREKQRVTACIHCEHIIVSTDKVHRYPVSKTIAHLRCVSQPSSKAMDKLIQTTKTNAKPADN